MEDFDSRRPYTTSAMIAALEAANLPSLPDDLPMMVMNCPAYHIRAAGRVRKSWCCTFTHRETARRISRHC
jgi:hypothetical protein